MSDYLTNLAARSHNAADVIQPRLASLFEPPRAGGDLGAGQPIDPEQGGAALATDEAAFVAASHRAPQPASAERPPTARPASRPVEPRSDTPRDRPLEAAWPSPAPLAPLETYPAVGSAPRQRDPHLPEPAPRASRDDSAPRGPAHDEGRPTTDDRRPTTDQVTGYRLQGTGDRGQGTGTPTPGGTADPQPPTPNPQPPIQNPKSKIRNPVVEGRRADGSPIQNPKSKIQNPVVQPVAPAAVGDPATRGATAPAIQVTIGRIEVRAPPPPAAPPWQPPSAPATMSLDDYLRRRAGGGDR